MSINPCLAPRLLCVDLRPAATGGLIRPASRRPSQVVLCLGNFDGVHLAHAALLREGVRLSRVQASARREDVSGGVLCFFHPSSDAFLSGGAPTNHLTTLREKLRLIAALGVDYAYLCDFSDVRCLSPTAFLDLLVEKANCVGAVCGFNHRFGAGAVGTPETLVKHFGADAVSVMPEMTMAGVTVSATAIRARLWAGDAEGAAQLLGRPYSLETTVTGGKQLGRTLGFPTANQFFLPETLIPAHGVYAALCHTPDGCFPAVANVGTHPTVDEHARVNCESHLIGYRGDLYGQRMRTELFRYIRPEEHFADLDTLRAAIARDAATAMSYIRSRGFLP